MEKVNLAAKLSLFEGFWSPRIVGTLNENYVKLVKIQGEFIWHHHDDEDEMFLVIQGRLLMQFRDHEVWIEPGEFIIVPKGVEHRPVAPEEVQMMLIEPQTTRNTGNLENERTVEAQWI